MFFNICLAGFLNFLKTSIFVAGISIRMLSGNNSILSKTGQARDITGEKAIAERVRIAYLGALATNVVTNSVMTCFLRNRN